MIELNDHTTLDDQFAEVSKLIRTAGPSKVIKFSPKQLKAAYEQYGPRSKEFYEVVRRFIIYVIRKYNEGHYDEELFFASYCQVLESFGHYKPELLNVASFVHSVVRNKVSSHRYHINKRRKESAEPLDFLPSGENKFREIEDNMSYVSGLKRMKKIRIVGDYRDVVEHSLEEGADSVHFRNMLWLSMGKEG